MHNALSRLQNVFSFMTTCAFTLAAFVALLSLLPFPPHTASPTATIAVRDVQVVKGRPHYYSPKREEYAQIRFDLDADLTPLFTWNTKQLFVYVTAAYPPVGSGAVLGGGAGGEGQDEARSEAVIWDAIIAAPSTPWSFQSLRSAYFPEEKVIKGRKATAQKKKKAETRTKALVRPGVLRLKNQKPKYQITDPSGILSERKNATLEVNWNVQPWVGALVWGKGYFGHRVGKWATGSSARSKTFDFPPLKGSGSGSRSAEASREREVTNSAEAQNPLDAAEATPVVPI